MPENLDHAREQFRRAKTELAEREHVLVRELTVEIHEHLDATASSIELTRALIREIPEQGSLDHNGARRDAIKKLEEMERELQKIHAQIEIIGGPRE